VDAPQILVPRRRFIDPAERRRRAADTKAKQRTRRLFAYFLEIGFAADDNLAFFLHECLQLQDPRQSSSSHHVARCLGNSGSTAIPLHAAWLHRQAAGSPRCVRCHPPTPSAPLPQPCPALTVTV
jgi:hypothetical protein